MFDAGGSRKNKSIASSSNRRRARTVVAQRAGRAIVNRDAMIDIVTKTAYFALATGVVVFVAMFLLTLTHS